MKAARSGLIQSALRVAEFSLARSEAEKLVAASPTSPEALALYADALWAAGLFDEAEPGPHRERRADHEQSVGRPDLLHRYGDLLRRNGLAEEDGVDMDIPDSSPGPEATLAQRQDLAALDDAFNALPVAWRECLILREVEELSYKEMARIMEVPIGTVMSRLSRARQALQREVVRDDQQGYVRKNGKRIEPAEETALTDARQ